MILIIVSSDMNEGHTSGKVYLDYMSLFRYIHLILFKFYRHIANYVNYLTIKNIPS